MDASLVGAPVFKTVCVALILSQVGSIPTHLRQGCEDCYDVDNVYEKIYQHQLWYTFSGTPYTPQSSVDFLNVN